MVMAVNAGAAAKYTRKSFLSARIPKTGLARELDRKNTVKSPARVMEMEVLAIIRGRNGARKLEYTSWTRCPPATTRTRRKDTLSDKIPPFCEHHLYRKA
jgi:hypothetical protein